ncbi:MAG: hypothetical protein H6621_01750 [Halobacteriovoraceae bacterium]|nr:hypothetical protein [Halobacteriovoraceae bacterium]MCB9093766.1 hypothetical protein [Halobacteriovoraceae bacterium]
MKTLLAMIIWTISFSAFSQATIEAANQEVMPLFLYQLINGTEDAEYAGGNGGPEDESGNPTGLVGMIREITGPTALGGGLASCGYTTCSGVPASGSCQMTDEGGTFTMTFEAPSEGIPSGYTGGGGDFDKRVSVDLDGVHFMDIEFSCSSEVGWLRFASPEDISGSSLANARHIEMFWDTEDSASTKLEIAMKYDAAGVEEEFFQAKFQTDSSSTYDLWVTRAETDGGSTKSGFRAGIRGNYSTKQATVFLAYEDGGTYADADTAHTNTDDILLSSGGGDVMCIDYTSHSSPSAVDGACSGLAIGSPGTLLINASGDMSINSTVQDMPGAMSSL